MKTNDPRIILSLNTEPLIKGRWGKGDKFKETVYMTTLSLLYAHLWYYDIELYTDELGYKIFEDLPIKVSLLEKESNRELWMGAKIEAMSRQVKPFVHIDTDVFLKQRIDYPNSNQVIVERKEVDGFEKHYGKQVSWFDMLMKGDEFWTPKLKFSLNCGTIGFNDIVLKDEYIDQYYKMAELFLENRESYQPLKEEWYEPCIVLEQYNLHSFLHTQNIKPHLLLAGDSITQQVEEANKIGYTHLYGDAKYQEENKRLIRDRLMQWFPHWHHNVEGKLLKYYNK